ncbi:putative secreted RxLR effector protein [Phytophthora cinnamomi]|uniref:putative secreted RxLR effector protein n=1 Tax=Phytophthora cinnamomi TaxID=4785 RepID=UPI00355A86A0|nr:putative secreted RxLR effector protein [Phytophthora cinnamomi]
MKLCATLRVLVAAFLVIHSTASAFPADQPANPPLADAFSINKIQHVEKRLLRSKPAAEDDGKENQEERAFNFNLDGLKNLFKAKTAEELAEAAKKAASKKFWEDVANEPSIRHERFPAWKKDNIDVSTIAHQLEAHGFKGSKFDNIVAKYEHFRSTGEIS